MAQMVQMTQEQLQQLIDAVRVAATSDAAKAAADNKTKSKGSFANCTARYGGQRSHEAVEEFITSVETYKELEEISDDDALKGLALLFYDIASVWWQGVRKEAKSWKEAIALIREHFSPVKPAHQVYMEIFENKQDDKTAIDTFVLQKRALLAQLPDGRHDEEAEIDLVYGLLNIKYRKHIARGDVKSFKDLLERGRIIEQNENEDEQQCGSQRVPSRMKRCTHCNFRGHTFQECRKRKQGKGSDE